METPELSNPFTAGKVIGENVSYEDYSTQTCKRGDPQFVMSRGELCEFAVNPRRWFEGYQGKTGADAEWGSLIDCLALTPDQFATRFAITPENYPCEATKKDPRTEKPWNWTANYCKTWRDERPSLTCITPEEAQRAEAAVHKLRADPDVRMLIECSKKQVMVQAEYRDKATGIVVPVRILIDLLPDKSHPKFGKSEADLKTTGQAGLRVWGRHVCDYDLHTQGALYLDVYTAATDEDRCEFRHVIQENFEPFDVSKRILSSEFLDIGRLKYQTALRDYCLSIKTGYWPNYDDRAREKIEGWSITGPDPYMYGQ